LLEQVSNGVTLSILDLTLKVEIKKPSKDKFEDEDKPKKVKKKKDDEEYNNVI
jgi:hypothetical protein